jgi:hypothetical protein
MLNVVMQNVVALSLVFLIHDNKTSNSVNNCWNNIITFYSETLQGSLVKKGSCLAPERGKHRGKCKKDKRRQRVKKTEAHTVKNTEGKYQETESESDRKKDRGTDT